MQKLTKKEFAARTGQKTKNLSNYINRGQVVAGADGMIDIENVTNQAFLGKHGWKGAQKAEETPQPAKPARKQAKASTKSEKPAPRKHKEPVKTKKPASKIPKDALSDIDDFEDYSDFSGVDTSDDENEFSKLARNTAAAEAQYKASRAVKTKHEAELSKIRVSKVRGSIIPTDIVLPIFVQHNQHILTAQKAADDEMLSDIAHRFGIGGDEVARLRGEWVKRRNEAVRKATEASEKGVDAVVKNFIDTKV